MSHDDDIADWDAAYVLGALSTEDRLAYEHYLSRDPDRAAKLTELAGLPGILNALTREEALALDPVADGGTSATDGPRPLDLMPALARKAAERQKRSRRGIVALAVATAAVFLAVGALVGIAAFPRSTAPTPVATAPLEAMTPTDRGGVTAALAVSEKKWGTRLDWNCQYTKQWSKDVARYDLVVSTEDGTQTTVASWTPAGDEAAGLAAATGIPTAKIKTVDIRVTGTTEPLAITTLPR